LTVRGKSVGVHGADPATGGRSPGNTLAQALRTARPEERALGGGAVARPNDRLEKLRQKAEELSSAAHQNRLLLQRVQTLTTVNEFLQATQEPTAVSQILTCALRASLSVSRSTAGSIQLFDPESGRLTVQVAEGPGRDSLLGQVQQGGEGCSVSTTVAESREPVLVCGQSDHASLPRRGSDRYTSPSFLSVPIQADGELVGVLNVTNPVGRDHYGQPDLAPLLELADRTGSAVAARREQDELKAFNAELRRQLEQALGRLDGGSGQLAGLYTYSEAIVRHVPLGLLIFNDQLEITYANPQVTQLLALEHNEGEAQSLARLPMHLEGGDLLSPLRSVVNEGCSAQLYPVRFEADEAKDPQVLRLIASPLRDQHGKAIAGLLAVEDATEQAELQRELMAAERQTVAGRLTAKVAHELNNPLDGILRFVNLALSRPHDQAQTREYLQQIRKGLERMVGIVGDLLELARHRPYPKQDSDNCNELVREAVKCMSLRAAEQQVEVRLDLAPHLPRFRCGNLYQVFANVIKNALDVMPNAGVLTIRSRAEGATVVVDFADTGPGMSAKVAERVFDPFYTTKPAGLGTGLGLAICHDIVQKYHGRIDVATNEGKGTTFSIRVSAEKPRRS